MSFVLNFSCNFGYRCIKIIVFFNLLLPFILYSNVLTIVQRNHACNTDLRIIYIHLHAIAKILHD